MSLLRRLARRYDLALSDANRRPPDAPGVDRGAPKRRPRRSRGLWGERKTLCAYRSYVRDASQHRLSEFYGSPSFSVFPAISEIVCPQARGARAISFRCSPMPSFMPHQCSNTSAGRPTAGANSPPRCASAVSASSPAAPKADAGYLDETWRGSDVVRLDGEIDWPELTAAIRSAAGLRRARYRCYASCRGHRDADGCTRTGRPTPVFGGRGRSVVLIGRGRRPARSSNAAMSGWYKIRCPACPASLRAASGGSTATATASTGLTGAQVISAVDQALAVQRAA